MGISHLIETNLHMCTTVRLLYKGVSEQLGVITGVPACDAAVCADRICGLQEHHKGLQQRREHTGEGSMAVISKVDR